MSQESQTDHLYNQRHLSGAERERVAYMSGNHEFAEALMAIDDLSDLEESSDEKINKLKDDLKKRTNRLDFFEFMMVVVIEKLRTGKELTEELREVVARELETCSADDTHENAGRFQRDMNDLMDEK